MCIRDRVKGISEGFHDASVSLVKYDGNAEILWCKQAERITRKKNERFNPESLRNVDADISVFYENVPLKNERRMKHMQLPLSTKVFDSCDYWVNHHESHAAAAYYTSGFSEDVVCVVIDAIGEWDTISIWEGKDNKLKKIKSWKYPYSLGLLYSAITHRIGLKPNEDEYITMGMAAFGEPRYDLTELLWKNNHKGVVQIWSGAKNEDLAASVQDL